MDNSSGEGGSEWQKVVACEYGEIVIKETAREEGDQSKDDLIFSQ